MKKNVVAIILVYVAVIFASGSLAEAMPFTFRAGVTFGMTKAEVISCESPNAYSENGEYLYYFNQESAGKDAHTIYLFDDLGFLYEIYVCYDAEHTNSNLYINDFNNIDDALKAKYGTPALDKVYKWSSSLFKNDKENHGLAVSMGYLTIGSIWNLEDVKIGHILSGDNYSTTHAIIYDIPENEESKDMEGI